MRCQCIAEIMLCDLSKIEGRKSAEERSTAMIRYSVLRTTASNAFTDGAVSVIRLCDLSKIEGRTYKYKRETSPSGGVRE